MIGELTNHLWQSTLFAIAAALLTIAFRKNRAAVRYGLWFAASFKFLIPFWLLVGLGSYAGWAPAAKGVVPPAISFTMSQIAQPFPNALPSPRSTTGPALHWIPLLILCGWVCGLVAVALMRSRDWFRVRAAVRSSTPIDIPAGVEVRSAPGLLEPGVVGLFHPILLLPEGIVEHLAPPQLEAVLAHELSHVRRRDNLTSALHMIVEAAFWFHPLVWWMGARLLEERERACDEAVLSLGGDPHDYAEGILNICRSYLESPLACVSGVTGSNLKRRLRAILTGRVPRGLTFAKKSLLGVAAIAALVAPIAAGMMNAPAISALPPGVAAPKFKTVSITPCAVFGRDNAKLVAGKFRSGCTSVQRLIEQAYGLYANGHENLLSSVTVAGGPAWTNSDLYRIDAEADGNQDQVAMNGPMLAALLEDSFRLKIHRETREVPVYTLTLDQGAPKMPPFQGTCIPWDPSNYYHPPPPDERCGRGGFSSGGADLNAATMADLCVFFLVTLDRPVIDETGLRGRFNFHLEMPTEDLQHVARVVPARRDPAAPAADPTLVSAIKTAVAKLGLNLASAKRPGEFIVIDRVERPLEK